MQADNSLIGVVDGGFAKPILGTGNITGTAAAPVVQPLTSLGNFGGPTPTHVSLGGPAVDAGSNPLGLAFDQRGPGFPRSVGGGVDIGATESDPNIPLAKLIQPADIVTPGGTATTIEVTYTDNTAIAFASLGTGDIRVTGPGGFDTVPTFTGAVPSADAASITATYVLTPPGGDWDFLDSGRYAINLEANQVSDAGSPPAFAFAQGLGSLRVSIAGKFVVTTTDDAGPGSLRDALKTANLADSPDTITFAKELKGAIGLTTGELTITQPVEILGPGPDKLTISGGKTSRIFNIDKASAVTIAGLTLTDGYAKADNPTGNAGGAIANKNGDLTLEKVRAVGNKADGNGGAIFFSASGGSLTIVGSDISGNAANFDGGGVFVSGKTALVRDTTISRNATQFGNGGGLAVNFNSNVTAIIQSTVSNNQAKTSGGGINFSGTKLSVSNSTVAANSAGLGTGGGINAIGPFTFPFPIVAAVELAGTVVSGNTAVSGRDINNAYFVQYGFDFKSKNTTIQATFSFVGTEGKSPVLGTNNQVGTDAAPLDAKLSPLGNYGGPAETHLPQANSPLLNAGSNPDNLTLDQRGKARVIGSAIDIGAVEFDPEIPAAAATLPDITTTGGTNYVITVTYSDDVAISFATLDNFDVRVKGPRGFDVPALFTGATPSSDAQVIVATYEIAAPGGTWDVRDSGVYTASIQFEQVSDTKSPPTFVFAADLGNFTVGIAGVLEVMTTADSGPFSLREAVEIANAVNTVDTITFAPSAFGTITLTTGELKLSQSLEIIGPGAKLVAVSGNKSGRIFAISKSAAITGLTLTEGFAAGDTGGAINSGGGDLILQEVRVTGNTADFEGGGVYHSGGEFVMTRSTVTGNASAKGGAGGLFVTNPTVARIEDSTVASNTSQSPGGGLVLIGEPESELAIVQSTISGNTSQSLGGGMYVGGFYGTSLDIVNSTITGNSAVSGVGGIFAYGIFASTALRLGSSIVSGNTAAQPNPLFAGSADLFNGSYLSGNQPVEADFSLIGVADNLAGIIGGNNQTGTAKVPLSAKLAPLADNGGPTMTHLPLAGSPVINAGFNFAEAEFDQRGAGFKRTRSGQTDIGATESNPPPTISGVPFFLSVNEGSTRTFTATASDPEGDAITFSLADGSPSWANVDAMTGVVTLAPLDGPTDSTNITVIASDGDQTASRSVKVQVNNVNPAFTLPTKATTVAIGTAFALAGTFTDPGVLDTHEAFVDYGDGSGKQALTLTGNSFNLNHNYGKSGAYTGTVYLRDDDMSAGSFVTRNFSVVSEAKLTGIDIDDGTDLAIGNVGGVGQQSSAVRRITLDFTGFVNVTPGLSKATNTAVKAATGSTAASLLRADGKTFTVNVNHTVVEGNSRLVLTFAGSGILGGSLADGKYTLSIFGENFFVNDGTAFGPRVVNFHRLFGDADGNGTVNAVDQTAFLASYRTAAGSASYRSYFDFDNDTVIAGGDYSAFAGRMGKSV